jgi:hypothetical protein
VAEAGNVQVVVANHWLKLLRRLLGLPPGRYVLVISVRPDDCDWSVLDVGKIEA